MTTDLQGCFTVRSYGGRQGEWGLSHGVLHNLYLVWILRVRIYIQRGKDQIQRNESCIYLVLEEEFQLDVHYTKNDCLYLQ